MINSAEVQDRELRMDDEERESLHSGGGTEERWLGYHNKELGAAGQGRRDDG